LKLQECTVCIGGAWRGVDAFIVGEDKLGKWDSWVVWHELL